MAEISEPPQMHTWLSLSRKSFRGAAQAKGSHRGWIRSLKAKDRFCLKRRSPLFSNCRVSWGGGRDSTAPSVLPSKTSRALPEPPSDSWKAGTSIWHRDCGKVILLVKRGV